MEFINDLQNTLHWRFQESAHNYHAVADIKQFAKKLIDCFVGTKIDDPVMHGNPWKWEVNEWVQHDNYDIAVDFPTIREWEKQMSGAEHKLCFRHIRKSDSVENGKNKNDNENNGRMHRANDDDNHENYLPSGKSTTSVLLTQFPNTTHNILIIEKVREIKESLDIKLIQNDPHYKTSNVYENNKISFRFLIDQLSLPDKTFHTVLTTLLYAIVTKDDDIKSQINDCNDGLRTVRDSSPCHSHIHNIKINDPDYDLSQESIPKKSQI